MSDTESTKVIVGQPGESTEITVTLSGFSGLMISLNGMNFYFHPNCKKHSHNMIQIVRSNALLHIKCLVQLRCQSSRVQRQSMGGAGHVASSISRFSIFMLSMFRNRVVFHLDLY